MAAFLKAREVRYLRDVERKKEEQEDNAILSLPILQSTVEPTKMSCLRLSHNADEEGGRFLQVQD
jgi:hypothetical protein